MGKKKLALGLTALLRVRARRAAVRKGVTLDQFVNAAVAEKLVAMGTAEFFRRRACRARTDVAGALALLDRMGNDDPPREGDEVPEELLTAT